MGLTRPSTEHPWPDLASPNPGPTGLQWAGSVALDPLGRRHDIRAARVEVLTVTRREPSRFASRLHSAIAGGLNHAYTRVKVDPNDYLERVRRSHGISIRSFRDMFFLPQELVDDLADKTISGSVKFAVLEGAGLGIGGMATVIPDLGILAAIVMRMIQKLSLLYGFEYSTEDGVATLWIAAASAAGLDLGREFIEKEAIERFVPRVMERIAARMSAEVAEKWSARLIPVLSGALGGVLNYYFVREWGRRAKQHFREKHLSARQQMQLPAIQPYGNPA